MAPRASLRFRLIALAAGFTMLPVERVGPVRARADLLKSSTGPAVLTGRRPPLASVTDNRVAGIPGRRYLPHSAKPGRIAFFHGGGWMLGSIDSHDICRVKVQPKTRHSGRLSRLEIQVSGRRHTSQVTEIAR
jgi:acetyl esterase/lipase